MHDGVILFGAEWGMMKTIIILMVIGLYAPEQVAERQEPIA